MSLTIHASLQAELERSDAQIIHIVQIDLYSDSPTFTPQTVKMTDCQYPIFDYPNCVSRIPANAQSIDIETRDFTSSSMTIEISDDGFLRGLIETYHIKGKTITITQGTPNVLETNFCPHWAGTIEDYDFGGGRIQLFCEGHSYYATSQDDIEGLWANMHPAEAILEILQEYCHVPAAAINTASFAYDYYSDISHYVIRRNGVSWSGGKSRSATLTDTTSQLNGRSKNWVVDGVTPANSDGMKLYLYGWYGNSPNMDIYLYDGLAGDAVLFNLVRGMKIGYDQVDLIADQYANYTLADSGASGSFDFDFAGLATTYDIALDAGTYVLVDGSKRGSPIQPAQAISELARLCNASVIEREDGTLEFLRYDPTAAAVDSWWPADVDELLPETMTGNAINQYTVRSTYSQPSATESETIEHTYTQDDETAQAEHSPDGGTTPKILEDGLATEWCDGVGILDDDLGALATDVDISIGKKTITGGAYNWLVGKYLRDYGMCGTAGAGAGDPPSQDAARKLTSDRVGYLLVEDEIIECVASVVDSRGNALSIEQPYDGSAVTRYQYYEMSYTAKATTGRGALGTTKAAHKIGALVYDITIPVLYAGEQLARMNYGCPVLKAKTSYAKKALQVGEFITVTDDVFVAHGLSGLAATRKWEIVGKEENPSNEPPAISWRLALVESGARAYTGGITAADRIRDFTGLISPPFSSSLSVEHDSTIGYDADQHVDWIHTAGDTIHVDNISSASVVQHVGAIDHNSLLNYVAAKHIDWTNASSNFNTSGSLTTTGSTSLNGAVLINTSKNDVDFRVSTTGYTYGLLVDAGNDRVGIHTSAPTTELDIYRGTVRSRYGDSQVIDMYCNSAGAYICGISDKESMVPLTLRCEWIGTGTAAGTNEIILDAKSPSTTVTLMHMEAATQYVIIGSGAGNEKLTVEGVVAIAHTTTPSNTAGFGKLWVNTANGTLNFLDASGKATALTT